MKQKIISKSGERMLTAREAAEQLACAPDYVGKLCRDGKLECVRSEQAWYVDGQSIFEFEKERELSKAQRARELARERKEEASRRQQAAPGGNPAPRAALIAAGASLCVGLLFAAGSWALRLETGQTAALAQIDSPFFGAELPQLTAPISVSSPHFFAGALSYLRELFSSDVRVQLSVRKPSADLSAATTTIADAFAPVQSPPATSSPQIVINPIVQHTVERVVVENGISPAMLSSIVKELAQGGNGSIQYNQGGTLAASSTALSWDDQLGRLTVAGAVHTGELCLDDVCLTKAQLVQLLATSTASTTP